MTAALQLAVDGPLATVTLAGGTSGPDPWQALADVGRRLPGSVRVVLLRVDGPGFGRGLDEDALAQLRADPERGVAAGQAATRWLAQPAVVSIAAVRGVAAGASLELALHCDLRVAASDAALSLPDAAAGLVPATGATSRLVALLGPARALELCLTGRRVGATEALAWGLLTAVVPPAELDAAARDLADAVLAAPRDAVVETKALLQGAVWRSPERQCDAERDAQVRLLQDAAPNSTGE